MDIITQILTGSLGGTALGLGGLFLGLFAGPQLVDLILQSGLDPAAIAEGLQSLLP